MSPEATGWKESFVSVMTQSPLFPKLALGNVIVSPMAKPCADVVQVIDDPAPALPLNVPPESGYQCPPGIGEKG